MRKNKFLKTVFILVSFVFFAFSISFGKDKKMLEKSIALFNKGNYEKAAKELKLFLEEQPSPDYKKSAYWYLGQSYEKLGDFGKAMSTYQLAAQLFPKDIPILLALADIYRYAEIMDRARVFYAEILKFEPRNFKANLGLAQTYYKLGFLSNAAESYKTAIEIYPRENTGLWKQYARCLFKQRKYLKAEQAAVKAIAGSANDPDAWFLLSRIYYENGKKKEAFFAISTAAKLAPERKDIVLLYSLWLSCNNQQQKAREFAVKVIKKEPREPLALFAMAFSYVKSGDLEEASNYLKNISKTEKANFIYLVSEKMIELLSSKND